MNVINKPVLSTNQHVFLSNYVIIVHVKLIKCRHKIMKHMVVSKYISATTIHFNFNTRTK